MLLAIFVPYSLNWYYQNATVVKAATLEIVSGTVRISRGAATADVAAVDGDAVLEGFTIKTDNTSRALLTLFDGSTVLVFENSEFLVKRLRTTRFTRRATDIAILERKGRLRIGVALPTTDAASYRVETPHALIALRDGSYAIEVGVLGTTFSVRTGSGDVIAENATVAIGRGQRSTVAPNQPPSAPASAALDLVLNGDFRQRDVGWTSRIEVEAGRRDDILGQTLFAGESDGSLVRFVRRGSQNSHGENGIVQTINRDVSDFLSLKLSLDFRLIYQSLSGGGYLGSEYPMMVRLTYRDAEGTQWEWARGFYYQNEAGYPTTYGEQMPGDIWIPYEKDLLSLEGFPRPFRILTIEVVASGWDYESMVRSVSILAE